MTRSDDPSIDGVRCMLMRGGSSKGAYFDAADLPTDHDDRDDLLLRIMGSPDARQIDGVGGAHPLTSKVAIVTRSEHGADLDYLFLQLGVDQATVSDSQNCGNLLAGVAPFALERGLIGADPRGMTEVRIRMLNTASIAVATVPTEHGRLRARGDASISGVPGTAAPIRLDFEGIAGGTTGSLLPTGNVTDRVAGVDCTLVDNGMPVVVMGATDLGITGYEDCAALEADASLRATLERVRLEAGRLMGLGDVTTASVPKLTLVAPPRAGGDICTRTFIPHRCHDAIGVLGAVSVATAALLPGSPAARVMEPASHPRSTVALEHPTGAFEAAIEVSAENPPVVRRAGIIRTARKLMDGLVFPRPA